MDKMKYYTVILDGIDKCGKDTIAKYIWQLDNRLNVIVRAWPSLYAYNKKFGRNTDYALPYKDAVYVHLKVDYDDWLIRCKLANEPKINYYEDIEYFAEAFSILRNNDYITFTYYTSDDTAYTIAKAIVANMQRLNKE